MKRGIVLALSIAALFLLPSVARAQATCDSCDPFYSPADQSCWYCASRIDYIDTCPEIGYSTCGEYKGGGLPPGCWPNYVSTSRTNVGTFGSSSWGIDCSWGGSCWIVASRDHHRVD